MSETHFLNVDLDLESEVDISFVVKEIEGACLLMTYHQINGLYRASFENTEIGIESIIGKFVEVVEALSEQSKSLWKNCSKREFNLGFQSGATPNSYLATISPKALAEVVNIGGSIGITIYPEVSKIT